MSDKRNALIDAARLAAAAGIILSHVDLSGCGAAGTLFGQFLSVRVSLMFFLAVIGYYVEKSCQTGENPIFRRVCSLFRLYGAWSLVYLALSFVMVVLVQGVPLGQFLISKVKSFFFSGSYYHLWFYPAAIYGLLFIGGAKKLLGHRAHAFLMPLALLLYGAGILGTGYLPLGMQLPGLSRLYAADFFEPIMHICCLGFPSLVFGMAAARKSAGRSTAVLLAAAAVYGAESVVLCLFLRWQENPQMLMSTPLLTVLFLQWCQSRSLPLGREKLSLFRTVSAGMYHVHPLFLAVFAIVLPGLRGLWSFLLCVICSAVFGSLLHYLKKYKLFALFC